MGKLTAVSVKNAKPGRHADGAGLYLLVKPTGARSWLLRVQVDGKRRDIGLGSVDLSAKKLSGDDPSESIPILERKVLSLSEAREKAGILYRLAKAGRDPLAERDKDRRTSRTFRQAAKACHDSMRASWTDRHAAAFLASLDEHAYPVLGSKRVDLIDAGAIRDTLFPIWTKKPEMAGKVRQRIAMVLNYSHGEGWRPSEAPTRALSLLLAKRPEGGNYSSMPFADLPDYVASLRAEPTTTGRLALLFLIFTAARSGEVRNARWEHIDLKAKLWNRPASAMKSGKAHTVTLNDQAVAVLSDAQALNGDMFPELVFPNSKGLPMSDMTISKIMRDKKLPYVPHGFRSTFRDWAAERMPSIPDPVAEAALAHTVSDRVVAAYKRTNFLDLRRQLLNAWGAYACGVTNVVAQDVSNG